MPYHPRFIIIMSAIGYVNLIFLVRHGLPDGDPCAGMGRLFLDHA